MRHLAILRHWQSWTKEFLAFSCQKSGKDLAKNLALKKENFSFSKLRTQINTQKHLRVAKSLV
jgi:intein-encoded DNA endonuclease-like protein